MAVENRFDIDLFSFEPPIRKIPTVPTDNGPATSRLTSDSISRRYIEVPIQILLPQTPVMKQKKSRNPAPTNDMSSVTLLDFFKSKPTTGTSSSTKKQTKEMCPNSGKVAKGTQEIIVIDSDSDPDDVVEIVDFVARKRRKLSPPAVFESPIVKPNRVFATTSKVSKSLLETGSHDMELDTEKGCPVDGSEILSFGTSMLLPNAPGPSKPSPAEPTSGPSCAPLQSEPTPLASLDLIRPTLTTCSSRTISSESTLSKAEQSIDIDLTLDDWGMGDDEIGDETQYINGDQDPEGLLDTYNPIDPKDPTCNSTDNIHEPQSGSNAFSVLMSGLKENEVWKEASAAEDKSKSFKGRRKAPFYKVLQGMPIAVDAFRYGEIPSVTAYFLTHAHSDHYTNLSSSWKHGPIYCSEGTANLIIHMLSVDKKWVHPLPMDTPTVVPNTNGVKVTLIEANHCPGSCLFFFEGRQTTDAGDSAFKSPFVNSPRIFRYLHCGDFRASPQHVLHPAVKGKVIDHVYLDTTYLDPKYTFPPQPLVVSACADLAVKLAKGEPTHQSTGSISSWFTTSKGKGKEEKPTLFVIGTYTIGKERIVKAVARALNSKIYCEKRKAAILRCQADPELHAMLTSNPSDAVVHLVPLGMIVSDKLKPYLERFGSQFSKVVGFRPTGWTYVQPSGTDQQPSVNTIITRTVQKPFTSQDLKPNAKSITTIQMYPVPYSEHSSFYELTCFAMSLNWTKMIATVNVGSERSRAKMAQWVAKWEAERKRRGKIEVVAHRHLEYW